MSMFPPKNSSGLCSGEEPTAEDLAAIEAEWPVIEAEMRLVDAEAAVLWAGWQKASELDWQRLRSAERAVQAAWATFAASNAFVDEAVA